MAEYIDHKLLKKRFLKRLDWLKKDIHDEYSGALYDCCESDIDLIDEIPSADVAPVVHGHWIHEKAEGGFDLWKCSRCGAGTDQNPEDILLYCFHCGAEMDGGDDGETD